MRIIQPPPTDESALHERVLQKDPVVSTEVFQAFADRIIKALLYDRVCDAEGATDAMVDAVMGYLHSPERYDSSKGSLLTYLIRVAKNKAVGRYRSDAALRRGDQNYYDRRVEDPGRDPKEEMENFVEAKRLLQRFLTSGRLKSRQEVEHLRLLLCGENSTRLVAAALELGPMPWEQLQLEVKRRRDRLIKNLERSRTEDFNDRA